MMDEINEENLDAQVVQADDPELLKELMAYAVRFEREDLIEVILEKTMQNSRLVEKLHDFHLQPPLTFSFFDDADLDEPED
ncbi:MAG: hypothetical protein IGS03_09260 [Candidatus Sericytochromatia bacterium]|nr:hypothetical protein [Candidatus Sericytochromatia bacterium]